MFTQGERIEKVTGLETSLLLTAPHIKETISGFSASVPTIFLTSRLLPLIDDRPTFLDAPPGSIFLCEGEIVGYVLPPVREKIPPDDLVDPSRSRVEALAGVSVTEVKLNSGVIGSIWEFIEANERLLKADFTLLGGMGSGAESLPDGVTVIGSGDIVVSGSAEIWPHVVLDARSGPILIEDGVNVLPFSCIEGPSYIGRGTTINGAVVRGGVTFGPVCRVGGEIECTIFQGHTNKAHDGFLGHSYVGEWVNLGAGTTNSDLKNNYSPVRVTLAGRIHDTGMLKMGSLLGDHVKTGIGTLINTGGVVGTGCSIFGGGVQPTFVPPFVWGGGGRYQEYRMKDFIETAARVMQRRELTLEENQRLLLESVYQITGAERADWLAGRKEG